MSTMVNSISSNTSSGGGATELIDTFSYANGKMNNVAQVRTDRILQDDLDKINKYSILALEVLRGGKSTLLVSKDLFLEYIDINKTPTEAGRLGIYVYDNNIQAPLQAYTDNGVRYIGFPSVNTVFNIYGVKI